MFTCNKDYSSNKLDEKLKNKFKNTFKFSSKDINKFILMPRKVAYPYKYMDDLKKFTDQKILQIQITYLKKEFIMTLKERIQLNIMICI